MPVICTVLLVYLCLYEILLADEQVQLAAWEYQQLSLLDEQDEKTGLEPYDAADDTDDTNAADAADAASIQAKATGDLNGDRTDGEEPKGAYGENAYNGIIDETGGKTTGASETTSAAAVFRAWRAAGFTEKECWLLSINQDYAGILEIPVLELSYPIAASHDNEDYLEKTFAGQENPAGCIFLDCGAAGDYSDRHTFIFGHNRRDGTMFGSLRRLTQDVTLVQQNPAVYLTWRGERGAWQIFAYGPASKNDNAIYSYLITDQEYDSWLKNIREKSWYYQEDDTTGPALAARRPVITLSTCYGTGQRQNLVVHAVKISEDAG